VQVQNPVDVLGCATKEVFEKFKFDSEDRGGIKIFKALARLASNSIFLLAKS
jgi:hypothetical protein